MIQEKELTFLAQRTDKEHTHDGHRKRLRQKYRQGGLDVLSDHEVLELLLGFTIPRGDTNPAGHALMQRFGRLSGVLDASERDLQQIHGVGPQSAFWLHLIPEIARRYSLDKLGERPRLATCQHACEYAQALMMGKRTEELYLLCLDTRFRLNCAIKLQRGTVDSVPVYTREVVSGALQGNAKNAILVHNHPSGAVQPSQQDIVMTQQVLQALETIKVHLLDHLIVGEGACYSFTQSQPVTFAPHEKDLAYAAEEEW